MDQTVWKAERTRLPAVPTAEKTVSKRDLKTLRTEPMRCSSEVMIEDILVGDVEVWECLYDDLRCGIPEVLEEVESRQLHRYVR